MLLLQYALETHLGDIGNIAQSLLTNEYDKIHTTWEIGMLKTADLQVGDKVSGFTITETGRHFILDIAKYNTEAYTFASAMYTVRGSTSYHTYALLDEDYEVVYISEVISNTHTKSNWADYNFRYVVFNNIFSSMPEPDIQVLLKDNKNMIVKSIE